MISSLGKIFLSDVKILVFNCKYINPNSLIADTIDSTKLFSYMVDDYDDTNNNNNNKKKSTYDILYTLIMKA